MAERRPIVLVNGDLQEFPVGDTLPIALGGGLFNNLAATAAPVVTNDNTENYVVGSRWVDVTNDNTYTCVDTTTGAAVWVQENYTGGGGSTTLDGLTDVDLTTTPPTDAQALIWDNATSTWIPGTIANGADGKTILNGAVAPTTEGIDGDFYIDTATDTIYGPKAAGTWPAGVSLVGPAGSNGTNGTNGVNGNTILYGAVAPTTEGVDGNFYIDTVTNLIYGPKATTWPAGVSLVGPAATMVQSELTGTTHTVDNTDLAGNVVRKLNNAAAITVTVAPSLTGTEPATFIQTGAGAVTFAPGAGVTINSTSGNLTIGNQYSSASLIPDAVIADTYYLIGHLIA